jgi:hypothetical protein
MKFLDTLKSAIGPVKPPNERPDNFWAEIGHLCMKTKPQAFIGRRISVDLGDGWNDKASFDFNQTLLKNESTKQQPTPLEQAVKLLPKS